MSVARLDTVGFSFPICSEDLQGATMAVRNYGTGDESVTWRRPLPGGGFLAGGMGRSAWVEASLPKRVGEDNVEGVTVGQAHELLEHLYHEATTFVEPDLNAAPREYLDGRSDPVGPRFPVSRHRSWETASLKRLDVCRDFDGITAIGPLLDGLSTVKQNGRSKIRRYADSDRGAAETLRVGPKAWAATLYDKHAESPHHAAPGRLRFEYRARSKQLLSKRAQEWKTAMATIGQIDDDKVQTIGRRQFAAVGFDREVAGSAQLAEAVNSIDDLSDRVKRDLVGYLACRAMGVRLEMSSNTERKYRQLASRLGLVLSDEVLAQTASVRLDYDTGSQQLVA